MLSAPKHGWSTITIGDWSDRCSYLDDVPIDLLNAVDFVLESGCPRVVKFDAEGWEYLIVFDAYETHIICPDKNIYKTIDVCIVDLAKELVSDIRRDFDGWVDWNYGELSEYERNDRIEGINFLCDYMAIS